MAFDRICETISTALDFKDSLNYIFLYLRNIPTDTMDEKGLLYRVAGSNSALDGE
jgi:hypothetical protein